MDALKKRRKLTDRAPPNVLIRDPEFSEDSKMYQSLLEMEKKLDWTITRKRAEIQDALQRTPTTTRTLRLFISHTVSGQAWQAGTEDAAAFDTSTGDGVPAWELKIEGRLLELPNVRGRDKAPTRKFSSIIKKMAVDLERDPSVYPDGNIVEWPRANAGNPAMDGFTLRRTGDSPTKVRVVLYLAHNPEQYKLSAELSDILGIKEDSRLGVIQAMWNYIKINNLQDKVDRRRITADEKLRNLFNVDQFAFQKIPELVNRHLGPPDPVLINYFLDPTQPPPERPLAWDIEFKTEDTLLKTKMTTLLHMSKESAENLTKIDDEIGLMVQSLHNSHLKRTFLRSFADDPALFIQTWLESQSRDLETILGSGPSEGLTIRQEELRRSEFFQLPWVEEAVAVQEGLRIAAKGMS